MNSIHYRKGYKYQLAADYVTTTRIRPTAAVETRYVSLTLAGELTVLSGYSWNGPSGPTLDTRNAMRGSLEHDVKYQLIRLGLITSSYKVVADDELKEVLREDGMGRLRAWYWCAGVKAFGRKSTRASSEPVVLSAP